jgi:hypothetical protein
MKNGPKHTFLLTASGRVSNSSSVVSNPVKSFMFFLFFLNRGVAGKLPDDIGRSRGCGLSAVGSRKPELRSDVELEVVSVWPLLVVFVVIDARDFFLDGIARRLPDPDLTGCDLEGAMTIFWNQDIY